MNEIILMRKKASHKLKNLTDEAIELIEKILRWRQMRLQEILDRYSKHLSGDMNQIEIIAADIHEPVEKVEQVLSSYAITPDMSNDRIIEALDLIDLTDEEKALLKNKAELKKQQEIQAHHRFQK